MWIALAVSVVTYIPLALVAKGVLRVSSNNWWKFERNGLRDAQVEGQRRRSISMIAFVASRSVQKYMQAYHSLTRYPVVYFILVIPTSVVRWDSGFGSSAKTLPSAATLATEVIFSLSGLANVLIFLFTRSDLFMVGNTESRGHNLWRPTSSPAAVPRPGNEELAGRRPLVQSVLPGADSGGWTLPSEPGTSESA